MECPDPQVHDRNHTPEQPGEAWGVMFTPQPDRPQALFELHDVLRKLTDVVREMEGLYNAGRVLERQRSELEDEAHRLRVAERDLRKQIMDAG